MYNRSTEIRRRLIRIRSLPATRTSPTEKDTLSKQLRTRTPRSRKFVGAPGCSLPKEAKEADIILSAQTLAGFGEGKGRWQATAIVQNQHSRPDLFWGGVGSFIQQKLLYGGDSSEGDASAAFPGSARSYSIRNAEKEKSTRKGKARLASCHVNRRRACTHSKRTSATLIVTWPTRFAFALVGWCDQVRKWHTPWLNIAGTVKAGMHPKHPKSHVHLITWYVIANLGWQLRRCISRPCTSFRDARPHQGQASSTCCGGCHVHVSFRKPAAVPGQDRSERMVRHRPNVAKGAIG